MSALTPTILLILDGWGLAPAGPGNAALLADAPFLQKALAFPARANLHSSGRAVGLPAGYMGNSEVGHMNLGAGRVVYQDMTRIDVEIERKSFFSNPVLLQLMADVKKSGGTLHFMGLLSDGGVHSHINHLCALTDLAVEQGVRVAVHGFTDGRDTSPTSGRGFVQALLQHLEKAGENLPEALKPRLASLCGRYYAMDRDKRWDRTFLAWQALLHGEGQLVSDPLAAMEQAYAANETDEFLKPRLLPWSGGKFAPIAGKDAVFFFNFRADRARQLSAAFFKEEFTDFARGPKPALAAFATLTQYDASMPIPAAYGPEEIHNPLGEVLSNLGVKQLRIAETEKYAHVTYFFNCGREEPFPGEERRLVPSPRDVATYDLKPEMSAGEVTELLLQEWNKGIYSFVVCNLANTDMVGHTGIIPAGIKAVETVDACAARIWEAVRARGGRLCITADHGNIEEMLTPDGKPQTAHTTNPVAFIVLDENNTWRLKPEGKLGDVSPTLLAMWGLEPAREMSGESLIIGPDK